jgi:phage-related protein
MPLPAFSWTPSYTPQLLRKPRVLQASFGDGYVQRVADGINNNPASWALKFSGRTQSEASAILAFFDALAGVGAFSWTDPNGFAGKWICQEYGSTRTTPLSYEVTATFVQVYDP